MFGNDHKLVGGFNIPQNYSTISDTVDHVSHVEPSFQVGLKLGPGTVIFLVRNQPAGKRRSMESTVTNSSKISREPSVSCCRGLSKKLGSPKVPWFIIFPTELQYAKALIPFSARHPKAATLQHLQNASSSLVLGPSPGHHQLPFEVSG